MSSLLQIVFLAVVLLQIPAFPLQAQGYLGDIRQELNATWPSNKTVNLVFHGHSVPAGYFNTPRVETLQAYPYLTLQALKTVYTNAVINVITTAIGGENSQLGRLRLRDEVLNHKPHVLFLDYALNDRGVGLDAAREAWSEMIEVAIERGVKVILMTPTPDLSENITNYDAPLECHSRQIRELAAKYNVGLVDAYAAFKEKVIAGEDLRDYMSQGNHPGEKGHRVVLELIAGYFFDSNQMQEYRKIQAKDIMKRVADRQIINFENQVRKGSPWKNSHAYWAWTNAAMYMGMAEWAKVSGDDTYWDFLFTTCEKSQWETGPNPYFADDLCIIQPYAQLFEKYGDTCIIAKSLVALDMVMNRPSQASLGYHAEGSHSRWCWCDALFMAPTSYARMGKLMKKQEYFDFLDKEFRVTCDSLYNRQDSLFFRDTRYISIREANGKGVFWGRGNGWVIGGLTIIIDNMPDDYPAVDFYVELYKEMIEKVVSLQDKKGFWHSSLLAPEAYPMPETSASGFFVYGILWGINKGLLDEKDYFPIANKGWRALCSAVQENGTLGYVQPIGADPKTVNYNDTEVYGTGAFLLAGVEMLKYLNR